jgi:hypothetical protein
LAVGSWVCFEKSVCHHYEPAAQPTAWKGAALKRAVMKRAGYSANPNAE